MVHLVTQSLSSFWLSGLDYPSNSPFMFPTILHNIFSRLIEYLTNTHISVTVPITSRRIVQSFVSYLIACLRECLDNELPIVSPSCWSLCHTSSQGNRLNLSDTLTEFPSMHLRWSRFWYCHFRKTQLNLLTRRNCHLQTVQKNTIFQYYWGPFLHQP